MLTEIFANRYANVLLRESLTEPDRRLLVQSFRILEEQVCPYWVDGKESARGKAFWSDLNRRLSMELGLESLSQEWFSYSSEWQGKKSTQMHQYTAEKICKNWMLVPLTALSSTDRYIKERLSLVELGFRKREEELAQENARLPARIKNELAQFASAYRFPGNARASILAQNEKLNLQFKDCVEELNTRLRQANYPLNYHNGFIQLETDNLIQEKIEAPFWSIVANSKWKNVDHDMKEALDLRDGDGRDPAFYAARALESAIKIISEDKGWTHGGEKGAHNYIDNLAAKKNGFVTAWEASSLKEFFSSVRNPFGHGPGSGEMPSLSRPQTEWAIEFCMSWIKNLIRRL